jgi:predicted DsbA family dithiol-disulfide isomerase
MFKVASAMPATSTTLSRRTLIEGGRYRREAMHVEIWSDIACPWCYVGKRRFEKALEMYEHRDEVTVQWRSFELDPAAPPESEGSIAEHVARKYGTTVEAIRARHEQMTEAAAADGIDFRFDLTRRANSFDGHRLLHLAKAHGLQDAMKERLLRALHTEGELISDHEVLRPLGGTVGIPEDEIAGMLASDRYAEDVREDERAARAFDISAVPCFVVDRRRGLAGAHPPEILLKLLRAADLPTAPRGRTGA